jgi:hypothetical protein
MVLSIEIYGFEAAVSLGPRPSTAARTRARGRRSGGRWPERS